LIGVFVHTKYQPLGEVLIRRGLITRAAMDQTLEQQKTSGLPIGKILLQNNLISENGLAQALADQKQLKLIDLAEYPVNPKACALIPKKIALKDQLIPIDFYQGSLVVAMANPLDIQALDNIRLITDCKVTPAVATNSSIEEAINHFMTVNPEMDIEDLETKNTDLEEKIDEIHEDAPITRFTNALIFDAANKRASDIHIEPDEKEVIIRYRIDGVLQDASKLSKRMLEPLISHLKIVSNIDIAEKRIPQDGRASMLLDGKRVDIRVATLPSIKGESLSIRILERDNRNLALSNLGIDKQLLAKFKKSISQTCGMVITTGPTGSGKSTTLYSILSELNSRERNIITIEDPVESSCDGITQIQINPKSGLTFATGLRAIVRNDPDIVMVGEIRDLETAEIAIRAALTGHFVLSTLHTNDAPSTITRLVDMGIEPFLVASSLKTVIAQRLARRLCDNCKQPYTIHITEAMRNYGFNTSETDVTLFKPGGCRKCDGTGYHGRIAIFELLAISNEISKLCLDQASAADIRKLAISQGMRTIRQDGFIKAKQGITTIDEVARVIS